MKKMRTIKGMIQDIKKQDPDSCVSKYMINKIIEKYKIEPVIVGNKYLYDYDEILKKLGLIWKE